MKVHAILLAGGSSNRFNNEENKVYFPIGGKPALAWPLDTLEKSEKVDSILLFFYNQSSKDDIEKLLILLNKNCSNNYYIANRY